MSDPSNFDLNEYFGPVIGSVLSLALVPAKTWKEGAINVLVGAVMAVYLTPLVIHFTQLPETYRDGAGFAVGFVGLILIRSALSILRAVAKDFLPAIKAWRGK